MGPVDILLVKAPEVRGEVAVQVVMREMAAMVDIT